MQEKEEKGEAPSRWGGWRLIIAGVAVAIVALVAFLGVALARKEAPTGASGITRVGKPAPEFTLPLFKGGEFTLARPPEKPLLVNFWASWCGPCWEEALTLEATWREYKDRVTFVGIDIQDKEEDALAFLKRFDITYPNGPDRTGKIAIDYGVVGIPATFFITREGVIDSRYVGALNRDILLSRLERILGVGR